MAPPRQRTAAVQDDSRSEGSSTTREHKTTGAKSRKGANGSLASSVTSREAKASGNLANVTSAPAGGNVLDVPKIPWNEMPLDLLHSYRHAYKLSSPSAFTSEYSHLLLSRGIGLRSPTSIAAQRAHLQSQNQMTNGTSQPTTSTTNTSTAAPAAPKKALHGNPSSAPNGIGAKHKDRQTQKQAPSAINGKSALHHIIGQDRVSKNQLALSVRKHFNSAGLAEQEAIARFLYKVREEGRGRHFRLRFQP
ncbi:histone deacetylase complex subunit SAP30 Sin3-binding domain-containing protein [Aspergillus homomorphus CBS 101889]|uniref:Histone deacetylase complex subunit SAP30 Sin3 binding domain-containing protein n=1 Tax=Aspergillus homomorphus (strain CBS 101889) TaxID=1450537 RepID=A0A395IBV4_ASPHC|nr:hypothetical protein BO97DRAFT_439527 [Aspergillus homomorphus CBS 101889]RAL17690.1 hypothetical protein BO97DRAFT_439527 [Aspergillus homomorphus CBS 101889]